jgi:solute carrier family 39 (zinc transporter), member 1/2/3
MSSTESGTVEFDPSNVDLSTADPRDVICALQASSNDYNGQMGARVSAIFVILILSSCATFFPVIAKRLPRLRIPFYAYLFARYFGAGVIVATAFIHLLDPAYNAIGPNTCVGMTGAWADFPWTPAIVLTSVMIIFILDLAAERYVEAKYGIHIEHDIQAAVTNPGDDSTLEDGKPPSQKTHHIHHIHHTSVTKAYEEKFLEDITDDDSAALERSFRQQIASFLILEFGVIFHSVIIGLNLGVVGEEFSTLYVVIVFHQSFEGLGIGARMSAIPFKPGSWLPWILCSAYGLTTPIAIAIGLGLRTTYNAGSFKANVVSGVFDSMSAGILLYTGLVELLARDFLFNPLRTGDNKRLTFMVGCVLLGAGLMSLLGKWA